MKKIERPHLLLCEGADADYFLRHWLASCIETDPEMDDIQIVDFGGIGQLTDMLETIFLIPGYEIIRSIAVIRDAEGDATGAVRSIKSSFQRAGLPVPDCLCVPSKTEDNEIRTGFALFPSCSDEEENGTLEDLCLRILRDSSAGDVLEAVDGFLECICENNSRAFRRPHKNRLHTYFSATDKYVSLKIGEAAKAKAFRWDCPQLRGLADFLREMMQD